MPFKLADSFTLPLFMGAHAWWRIVHTDNPTHAFCAYMFAQALPTHPGYEAYMAGVKIAAQQVVNQLNHGHTYTKFHRIFYEGHFVTDVPWADDDNGGLPWWYFNAGDFLAIEIDLEKDTVEFIPAIGPAPCWEGKFSAYNSNEALYEAFNAWCQQTFGMSAHNAVNS